MSITSELNAGFLQLLNDPSVGDQTKSAELQKIASGIVKTFVEQEGFTGKILPPQPLTREQCIPTGLEGSLYVLRPIDDHQIESVEMSREGLPTGQIISGKDYKIVVSYREAEEINKDTRSLQDTMTYDIQDIFENRMGLSLQKLTDKIFMQQVWSGLGYLPMSSGALTTTGSKKILDLRQYWGTSGNSKGISSEMIVLAQQKFGEEVDATGKASTSIATIQDHFVPSRKPLVAYTLLMNIFDFHDFSEMPQSEMGSILRAEWIQGYNLPTFKNVNIVTTLHTEIVPRGRMYFFASPDFIGHNFEIDPVQVLTKVDTFNHELRMKAVHFAGQGIGNKDAFWEVLFTPRGSANPGGVTDPTCPVL